MADLSVDISKLPDEIRDKLAELDLELSEGDITQKGYEKKRTRLLAPYQQQPPAGNQPPRGPRGDAGSGRLHTRNRRTHRRVTHNEKRYHSECIYTADTSLSTSDDQSSTGRDVSRQNPRHRRSHPVPPCPKSSY